MAGQSPKGTGPWLVKAKPRAWQREALRRWSQNRQGVVKVVTGGGKTTFAQMCISEFLRVHPSGIIVVVVPTYALLDQWSVSFQEDMGVPVSMLAHIHGASKDRHPKPFTIAVINSVRR